MRASPSGAGVSMRFEYICIALVALFWGGYPLVTRSTGVTGPIVSLVMTLSAAAAIAAATAWQGVPIRPSASEIGKLLIAGAMMGVGLLAFNAVANSRHLDASVSIPIMDTLMLLATFIGAIVFFAEPVTAKKLLGVTLLIAGIALLRPE
jgi:drug/metabolite transporter (DMT)-like permease